ARATTCWWSRPRASSSASRPTRSPRRAATPWACASSTWTPTTRSAPSPGSTPRRRRPPKRRSRVLDLKLIRDQREAVAERLAPRGADAGQLVRDLLTRDADRRRILREAEELKAQRNRASEAIGQAKRRGEDASAEQARMREVSDRIRTLDAEVK